MACKSQRGVFLLVLCTVLLSLAETKGGKKLEESSSFDVKPTGSISHQTIELVRGFFPVLLQLYR